jgi:hypothetical protein
MSLHDKNGGSSSMAEIPVAMSIFRGLPDLGSFESLVLRTRKRAEHLDTVGRVSASLWYIGWFLSIYPPDEARSGS